MKRIVMILLAVIGLLSCKKEPETISVPFEKLDHYFATIDVSSPTSRKIMDQETFDSMFGAAFSMSNPQAPLDFTKEFVISVVNPTTDEITKLTPVSLVKENGNLVFTYPKDGRMEMVAVGFNVYEDCRGIVERNPQIKEAARGLVRIDPDWLRRFFA